VDPDRNALSVFADCHFDLELHHFALLIRQVVSEHS